MVASADMPGWPGMDPCGATTGGTQFQAVVGTPTFYAGDATRMDLSFDPKQAYIDPTNGTTFYVQVYNTGSGLLQKSGCGVDPRTLPWFKIVP